MKLILYSLPLAVFMSFCTPKGDKTVPEKPNIVIFYADDIGFGDIGIQGAVGVETPCIDNLAENGLRFLDGHCSAATCTPSRYSLLTGSYAFRNNAAILPGDAPALIRPGSATIASMFQKAGYKTGVVGKWHLGLGDGFVNWNEEIKPGPLEIGFDYCFLIPATGDRVPCVFVENHRVVGLDPNDPITVSYSERIENEPVGMEHPEMLKLMADMQHSEAIVNGVSRIGHMQGGEEARWVDEDFADVLVNKANKFINSNKEEPFFLFFSFHDIHVPRVPHSRFVGKSTMGPRGDAICQMDWCTGEIVKTLEELGLDKNTLIIFSSDNGPVLDDGYFDQAEELIGNHNPSGIYRGGKYSAFEAGTRVPTIVYWPGEIKTGVSNALVTQVDLYASLAKLVGQEIPNGDAPDSFDMLSTWLGRSTNGRKVMLEEAFTIAVRDGNWKYIEPVKSDPPAWFANKRIESGLSNEVQLFNLENDPGEQKNVALKYPEKVKEMQQMLIEIRKTGIR